MKIFTGAELMDTFVGLDRSMRRLDLIVSAPNVEAKLKSDPDLEWAVALLIENGITPDEFEAVYLTRKGPQ